MSALDSSPSTQPSAPRAAPTPRSHLMDLPPEIRNNIYELVLTQPDGVLRYVPRDVAASRSYDLPNKDSGAHATEPHSSTYNDLQLVCKALHQETHLLELKYNNLSFVSYVPSVEAAFEPSKSATCIFLTFITNISAPKRDWVRNVEIKSGIPSRETLRPNFTHPLYDTKETLFQLATMCKHHPETAIKYRLPTFAPDERPHLRPVIAVLQGMLFKYRLRNEQVDLTLLPTDFHSMASLFRKFGSRWSGDSSEGSTRRLEDAHTLRMPNLRFYPMEDIIEDGTFNGASTRSIFGVDRITVYEKLVKSWLAEGF